MINIVFEDVETVPQVDAKQESDIPNVEIYQRKFAYEIGKIDDSVLIAQRLQGLHNMTPTVVHYRENAALYAEFCKIVSITIGVLKPTPSTGRKFFVKTFCGDDEKELLQAYIVAITESKDKVETLAGHNVKEFDAPMLMRRMLVHGLELPKLLQLWKYKPWDLPYLDTMEMWSGSQWKYKAGLHLLCTLFGIPSPKENTTGGDVYGLYYGDYPLPWERGDALKKLGLYNAGDVIASARLFARLAGFEGFRDDQIVYIESDKSNEQKQV
jgi:hypothetical protein